ncbi:intermembrane phospholipid transport protein YdbH family protein [Halopseudomonas bauzanensis]|uniref:Dicarboxylate transport n=1 Tax=Halopseudomonas bauzanensis TaxID=653930 RepID=A0A1H9U1N6_9GAMM|nr:YdbH domain-containing protein [Halopseudomonas bauzanensis]SES03141.1 Dicarboxylate transport [Halopseudomonas bauzanensis]SFM03953.1 Dicarboxylate transport [Halopseudomonas bauzanensis]
MRKAVVSAGAVLLVLLLAAVLTGQWLQRTLTAAGLEQLHWQQLRWTDGALWLGEASGVQVTEQGRLGFRLDGIRLQPTWRDGPRIEQLLIDELQLVWQSAQQLPQRETETQWQFPDLEQLAGPLSWLPRELAVRSLLVQLPCEDEWCRLQGELQVSAEQQPLVIAAQLALQADEQYVQGQLQLREDAGAYLLQAELELPQPLPLAGLGQLSGHLHIDLENRGDQWLLHAGQLDARLARPELQALASLPAELRPDAMALQVTPQPGSLASWRDTIPLAMHMALEGGISGQLDTQLELSSQPQWQARLRDGLLQLDASKLAMAGLQARTVRLDWPFLGHISEQQLNLQLGKEALVTAQSLSLADVGLQLTGLRAEVGGASLSVPLATPDQLQLDTPLRIGATRLAHAALKPQGWNLNGRLQQSPTGLTLDGSLAALSGLNADLRMNWPSGQPWQLQATLQEIFLRAADPLMGTFTDWPALLSFSSGRITGQLQATGRDGLDRLTGQLSLSGGQGIYDRASFTGLSLPLEIMLQNEQLQLDTDALRITSLDPGLPLGPLQASGRYRATLNEPTTGALDLRSASLGVLDGKIILEPATLDLGQARQTLVAMVEGVELARLFEVYPAEGLSGQGTLDGRFPISLVDGNLLIADGRLQAREPGVLRYQAEQLRELAASNPNLEQLAVALDNFQYQVLASDLSYDEQGVLVLGLRLEGSNPAFQQGRPVHLNIRLEEDIPALLTSLQLTGKVNEVIRKRVEQFYLQRRSP